MRPGIWCAKLIIVSTCGHLFREKAKLPSIKEKAIKSFQLEQDLSFNKLLHYGFLESHHSPESRVGIVRGLWVQSVCPPARDEYRVPSRVD